MFRGQFHHFLPAHIYFIVERAHNDFNQTKGKVFNFGPFLIWTKVPWTPPRKMEKCVVLHIMMRGCGLCRERNRRVIPPNRITTWLTIIITARAVMKTLRAFLEKKRRQAEWLSGYRQSIASGQGEAIAHRTIALVKIHGRRRSNCFMKPYRGKYQGPLPPQKWLLSTTMLHPSSSRSIWSTTLKNPAPVCNFVI